MFIKKRQQRPFLLQRGSRKVSIACDAGQSLVELALVMPVLVTMLLGTAELAGVAFAAIEVSNAAKAGVQYAAYSHANAASLSAIQAAAISDAPNITLGTPTVTSSCVCSNGAASTCLSTDCATSHIEKIVTVTTQTTFSPLIHLPGLPTTFTLQGVASQKVVNQ